MNPTNQVGRLLHIGVVVIGLTVPVSWARELTFEERVRAQETIERIYYAHQIGAEKPFEEAVPRAVFEGKVHKYLGQSVALQEYWKTPVSTEMLERETERMARQTRMPNRLRELFAALGDDAFLVQECLARPALVDRLTRNFFAFDERIHGEARREAEALRAAIVAGSIEAAAEHPLRTVSDLVEKAGEADGQSTGVPSAEAPQLRLEPDAEKFAHWREKAHGWKDRISPLTHERERFVVRVLLQEERARLRIASFSLAKTPWDEWWRRTGDDFDGRRFRSTASSEAILPTVIGCRHGDFEQAVEPRGAEGFDALTCVEGWDNGSLDDVPAERYSHTAVWTGSRMIVWGGYYDGARVDTGGQYDPATDTWTATSVASAPSARSNHAAVWTGSRMVVWGGFDGTFANTGGQYDPGTDTWTPTSTASTPSGRYSHTAIWTGSRMVVWGGFDGTSANTGAQYAPATDTWTAMSMASAPSGRGSHTAVWTGDRMVVWGGYPYTSAGGQYDPATDNWTATSIANAPSGRHFHTAVWTGSRMVVWGGCTEELYPPPYCVLHNTGGQYNPMTDTWTSTSTASTPLARYGHTAVWTGDRMVVWGGYDETTYFNTGGQYDPATDTWTPTSTADAPSQRHLHTAVWTGSNMVVWGGFAGPYPSIGGRYDPATDTWTPTSMGDAPSARAFHTTVWTGSQMVVWGGSDDAALFLNTGGQYDPATDTWKPTSLTGAPSGRNDHTAVWTGSRMVVWGGDSGGYVNSGGQYNPSTDIWTPTSTVDAPSARAFHTTVWTGSRMVVWGGSDYNLPLSTGGKYDPQTDEWKTTSTVGTPSARAGHAAAWTGSRMVVWGGFANATHPNTGGQYDPATDTWTPTSIASAPSGRYHPTAVWTGSGMVVWGGSVGTGSRLNTGGHYDPASDTWVPTSMVGVPSMRYQHTAVWTGSRMVVWGGYEGNYGHSPVNTGGQYDPATDTWTPTSTAGAASARGFHTAIWTDSRMIVWGGRAPNFRNTGGMWTSDSPPGETLRLRFSASPPDEETIQWDPIPNATRYDIVRGDLAALPLGPGGGDEMCFDDLPSAMLVDSQVPTEGFFYVARGENDCGSGPWGNTHVNPGPSSNGPPRMTVTCP